jgi:hypothetical protein
MPSILDVYNQALGTVGARAKLSSIADNLREAEVCNQFYEPSKDEVFCSAFWPSLRSTARLVRVAERDASLAWATTDPSPPWLYAYRLPNDFVRPRYLQEYSPFTLEAMATETALHTDVEDAVLIYTRDIADPNRWEPMLQALVVAVLALKIGRALGIDQKAYARAVENFQYVNAMALTAQANTDIPTPLEHIPDWIAAREGSLGLPAPLQYIYPTQALVYGSVG